MIEVQTVSAIGRPPWDRFHQGILPHFDQHVQRYYMRLPWPTPKHPLTIGVKD